MRGPRGGRHRQFRLSFQAPKPVNRGDLVLLEPRDALPDGGRVIECDHGIRIHIPVFIQVDAEQVGPSGDKQEAEDKAGQRFVD